VRAMPHMEIPNRKIPFLDEIPPGTATSCGSDRTPRREE